MQNVYTLTNNNNILWLFLQSHFMRHSLCFKNLILLSIFFDTSNTSRFYTLYSIFLSETLFILFSNIIIAKLLRFRSNLYTKQSMSESKSLQVHLNERFKWKNFKWKIFNSNLLINLTEKGHLDFKFYKNSARMFINFITKLFRFEKPSFVIKGNLSHSATDISYSWDLLWKFEQNPNGSLQTAAEVRI